MKHGKTCAGMPTANLSASIAELEDLLTRLSKGDTTLRADTSQENDIFRGIKQLINQLAEHIQDTSDYAHEMAIGLCEHYDTLSRIAGGDFSARATMDSGNELVGKLGELINREADVLTGAISRAQRAEEDKQAQLQLLQTLIDTIPSPVYYKDSNGCYLGCNKAFEASAGLSRHDLIGKTAFEIWPGEQATLFHQRDRELLQHPGVQIYEDSVRNADGTQREIVFNKATFHNEDGTSRGLVGIMLDITERKRAEDALAFQNILLSTQQEASIDGLLVVDENANIISYNHRFVEIMDIPDHLLVSREDEPVLQHVTSRVVDPKKFLEKVKYLYEHRQEICRDEISLCNGKILDRYTVPLLGADGRYYGRLWSFRDITERKTAEIEVNNAFQQLQDIIEFLPDATFVVDKEKRVIAWNRAIEKMTGLKKEDVLGKGDYAYAVPFYGKRRKILIDLVDEDVDVISRDYTAIKIEGRTLFAETYVPSFQNGGSRYFWGTASPLFDKQGNKVGGIESIRDITEYRRSQQENTRLESQLHYAHMIESLMIKLGHDLRTPLTPLTILLPLIEKRVNDLELRKMVDICCKSTFAMKKLADKTQFLGKISTSVNQDVLESINLYIALEQILSEHMDSMVQKNVTCRNNIDRSMVVRVIPEQIFQLFDNLISNAIHYSAQQGVIRVTAEEQNGVITVAVHDDGIGLAPENLERIFDEFFKVDESRHDLDASGLGLAICKRIVHNHHGRIWAESAGIGRGTTIKFTINEQSTGNGSAKELK